jgi:hypothetical protein
LKLKLQLQTETTESKSSDSLFVQMRCIENNEKQNDGDQQTQQREYENSFQTIRWSAKPNGRMDSFMSLYRSLVRSTMKLNLQQQPKVQAKISDGPTFDFPVFVMNLPHRHDRRRNMEGLLRSLGFSHVIFPYVTLASAIDVASLVECGFVQKKAVDAILSRSDKGPRALPAYLANALDQV